MSSDVTRNEFLRVKNRKRNDGSEEIGMSYTNIDASLDTCHESNYKRSVYVSFVYYAQLF